MYSKFGWKQDLAFLAVLAAIYAVGFILLWGAMFWFMCMVGVEL